MLEGSGDAFVVGVGQGDWDAREFGGECGWDGMCGWHGEVVGVAFPCDVDVAVCVEAAGKLRVDSLST